MATEVASLYASIGADTKDLKKGLTDAGRLLGDTSKQLEQMGGTAAVADKQTAGMGATLMGMGKMLMGATAAVAAFGVAAKKAFDFSEQGASVIQTGLSFDRLGVSIETMRAASLGTVDDMTLMSSTLTLTAGASEALQAKMLDAAPRLLEIAKAANAVNPAVGDTAFLFDSLTRGIKRSSPFIIDNTGLILKIGAANEAYAEQLGKTIEELTAEEKQIALLNATLEAGSRLIEQAGGSTAAYGDAWASVRAAITNATGAMKENAAEGLLPIITYMADYLQAAREISELDFDEGYTEVAKWENLASAQGEAASEMETNARAIARGNEAIAQGFSDVGASAPPAAVAVETAAGAFEEYSTSVAGYDSGKIAEIISQQWEMSEAAAAAALANLNFAASIGEMSLATFAAAQIDLVTEAMLGAKKGTDEIDEATRAILTTFGLLTPAEEKAAQVMGDFAARSAEDGADVQMLAGAILNVHNYMQMLEDKEIDLTINTRFNTYGDPANAGGAGGYVDPGTGSGFGFPQASGGDYMVNKPTLFLAGEAGPERATFTPMSGGAGGSRIGSTWMGDIIIQGTGDPESTANLVLRKLADRGLVSATGGLR